MVKRILTVAGLLAALSAPSWASTIALRDTTGDPLAVTIAPGGTFQLDVFLSTTIPTTGVSYYLQSTPGGLFTIVGRTLDLDNPFTDMTTSNSGIAEAWSPQQSRDLGGGSPDVTVDAPVGVFKTTLTFALSNLAAPGQYAIATTLASVVTDSTFVTYDLPASEPYIVTVAVPEPTTMALVGLASMMLIRPKRR